MNRAAWADTYRGTVFPWETDIVEHLMVAYYFERQTRGQAPSLVSRECARPGLDTYRGTVFPWETDIVEHLTVAYYFERFADATLGLLDGLGLGVDYMQAEGRGMRDRRLLRAVHARATRQETSCTSRAPSLGSTKHGLRLAHRVFNSDTGVLSATMEQRNAARGARVARAGGAAGDPSAALPRTGKDAPGTAPPGILRWQPGGHLKASSSRTRDAVKPWEIDVFGQARSPSTFTASPPAGIQAFAAFGMTPAYMREHRRGMSTFEFQLEFPGGASCRVIRST